MLFPCLYVENPLIFTSLTIPLAPVTRPASCRSLPVGWSLFCGALARNVARGLGECGPGNEFPRVEGLVDVRVGR